MSNLDEALERFHLADLEYGGGLANHGPMGVEALEGLGHQALIPAFLDLYVPRLPPAQPGRALSDREAESALGRNERSADWVATFEARLGAGDWRAVVSSALPELLPGVFAAAGHGFLRTAHAIRNLERADSPLRRRELARGLAHWSARFQRLPGLPGSRASGAGSLAERLANTPRVGDPSCRQGSFFEVVECLDERADFVRAVESLPRPAEAEVESALVGLSGRAARLYCAHPHARIAYVHAVTLPAALLGMLGYVDADPDASSKGQAALYVAQAVMALHAVFGEGDGGAELDAERDAEVVAMAKSWDEIRYRAACSIQEHAIKMAEACLRLHRRSEDPIFALAAADAALRLEGTRSAGGC